MMLILLALAAFAVTPAPALPASQADAGPSFACSAAATAVEKAVCADPTLSGLDRQMAQLFAAAKRSAFGSGPSNQLAAQRTAVKNMRSCTTPRAEQPLSRCLQRLYTVRIQELAIATLIAAPATALPILRRQDPVFAPILEAVQLWSEAPIDADWNAPQRARSRAKITSLLQPYLSALQTKDEQSFGNAILRDPGQDGVAVTKIEDIFLSERHFAALLQVLGPYLEEPSLSGIQRDLPCVAIVRHPALLSATGPVFGSTMDNFVLGNDCQASLPALPQLEALQTKLYHAWPQCEGTIRFAIYRGFAHHIDAARLGITPATKAAALPERKGVSKAEVAGVEHELATYYQTYLGRSPAAAATSARNALAAILADAQNCD
ncbi:uncharacterized protein ABIC65_000471 [Sphingomonas trueperi]|uniref:lysozyme inhibitor LprI family protein n=1 Tax=Sphingomonas trueperi TaxID=53317 RepID=UPI0033994612